MKRDMLILVFGPCILAVVICVALIWAISKEEEDCAAKGGVRIAAKNGTFCVSPEALK
jgi:hypothetical protein